METISFYTKLAAVLLIATATLAGCNKEPVKVSGVSLDKTMLTLTEGGSEILTATVTPADADNKAVTWAVTEGDAVIVDAGGKVIAVKTGTATVTVTTADGGFTAECVVMVLRGVTLNKTKLTLLVGRSETLLVKVAPGNTTDTTVEWTSSNPDVATVSGGTVNALGAGTAIITATNGGFKAECTVTVIAIAVTGVKLNKSMLMLTIEASETLAATIAPDYATDTTVEWISSNIEVATVAGGTVTAVAKGIATITATTADGNFTALCTVIVSEMPMTLTTKIWDGHVDIYMAGTGEAVIYWGDGSEPQTVTLEPYNGEFIDSDRYPHTLRGSTSYTIVIDGQNITHLDCNGLDLTALDVTKNTALTYLNCFNNELKNLDVTKNTALTYLWCAGNPLMSLDVTNNTALIYLNCHENQLTILDVNNNTALTKLLCDHNLLTNLDVTKNTMLTYLSCSTMGLRSLDVTKNTALTHLNCHSIQLRSLDVTKNTMLEMLYCNSNQLTAEGINALFSSLHGNYGYKEVYIANNPGTYYCDRTIATAKGWAVGW